MKKILPALLICFLFLQATPGNAREASVSGSITLTALSAQKKRTFRGRSYRSRLEPTSRTSEEKKQTASPYKDVVISAHPLSFEAAAKPLSEPAKMEQIK